MVKVFVRKTLGRRQGSNPIPRVKSRVSGDPREVVSCDLNTLTLRFLHYPFVEWAPPTILTSKDRSDALSDKPVNLSPQVLRRVNCV